MQIDLKVTKHLIKETNQWNKNLIWNERLAYIELKKEETPFGKLNKERNNTDSLFLNKCNPDDSPFAGTVPYI